MVSGLVEVVTLPPIIISEAANFVQATRLVTYKHLVGSAASSGSSTVTWKLFQNAVTTPLILETTSSVNATPPAVTYAGADLADNDLLSLQITGLTGSPKDLAITLVFEHVAA